MLKNYIAIGTLRSQQFKDHGIKISSYSNDEKYFINCVLSNTVGFS